MLHLISHFPKNGSLTFSATGGFKNSNTSRILLNAASTCKKFNIYVFQHFDTNNGERFNERYHKFNQNTQYDGSRNIKTHTANQIASFPSASLDID